MRLPQRSSKAFTLIELIVVIVILGILALIAIPTFGKVIAKSQDESTLTSLRAIARNAQALRALDQGTTWGATPAEAIGDVNVAASAGLFAIAYKAVEDKGADPGAGEVSYLVNDDSVVFSALSGSGKICMLGASPSVTAAGRCVTPSPTPGVSTTSGAVASDMSLAPGLTKRAPAAPTNITATAGAATATVSWTAPTNTGSDPITGYVVTASTNQTMTLSTPTTTLTFANLTAGTPVTFTVQAVSSAGTGVASLPSNSVTPTTPVTTPTSAPRNVTLTRTAGSATVSWQPGTGTWNTYQVYAGVGATQAAATSATSSASPTTVDGTVTTYVSENIAAVQWYCYQIAAKGTAVLSAKTAAVCTETGPEANFVAVDASTLYTSFDGASWGARSVGPGGAGYSGVGYIGGAWYVYSTDGSYYKSADLYSWAKVKTSLNVGITSLNLSSDGQTIVAGTKGRGITASTDGGATWKTKLTPDYSNTSVSFDQMVVSKNAWYATSTNSYLSYSSADNGATWNYWTLGGNVVKTVAADSTKLVAYTYSNGNSAQYTSTDGSTWSINSRLGTISSVIAATRAGTSTVIAANNYSGSSGNYYRVGDNDSGYGTLQSFSSSGFRSPFSIASDGTKVVIGGYGATPVMYSSNAGASWYSTSWVGGSLNVILTGIAAKTP